MTTWFNIGHCWLHPPALLTPSTEVFSKSAALLEEVLLFYYNIHFKKNKNLDLVSLLLGVHLGADLSNTGFQVIAEEAHGQQPPFLCSLLDVSEIRPDADL